MWRPDEKQVAAALKVLAPAARHREAARSEIELALAIIAHASGNKRMSKKSSKAARAAVGRLLAALTRSQAAARAAAEFDPYWALYVNFMKEIARCQQWLAAHPPARPPRRTSDKKKLAVLEAQNLFFKFGDTTQLRATRGNAWHQLAAILYGDAEIDLLHYMTRARL